MRERDRDEVRKVKTKEKKQPYGKRKKKVLVLRIKYKILSREYTQSKCVERDFKCILESIFRNIESNITRSMVGSLVCL